MPIYLFIKKAIEKRSYYSDTPGKFALLKELKRNFLQIFVVIGSKKAGRMSFDASIRVPIALPGGATEDALESIMSDGESTTSSQPRQLLPPQKKPIFIGMSVSLTTPRSPSSMILT